jgi:hypothetical protein
MQLWKAYLIQHPAVADDFILDMESRATALLDIQNKYLLEGELEKARFAAHENHVYRELAKALRVELAELKQQTAKEGED